MTRVVRVERWLFAAILLLAALLRLGWPTLTEFKFSEARLAALALEFTREGRLPLVGVPSSAGFDHSPLSVYLYLPPFLLTTDPIPATIYGGLVGVAAVALCWRLARRWPFVGALDRPPGGRWAAPIAALLLAVSPWAVAFGRKIWQVTFVPLLVLIFLALVVAALVEKRRWSLAGAFGIYALLLQVHPSAIALAPAFLLWLILFWREVRLGPLLAGGALALLTALPFLVHQMQNNWPALAALHALPEATWDLSALRLGWEAISGRGIAALAGDAYPLLKTVPQLGRLFNLVGWLVLASALVLTWRAATRWKSAARTARINLILLSCLAIPVLFNLRHSLALHLHFFALILPAAYLVSGRGVAALLTALESRPLRTAVIVALGSLAAVQVVALLLLGRFVADHDTPGGFGAPLGSYLAVADQAVRAADEMGAAEILVVGQGDSPIVDAEAAIFDVLLRGRIDYRFVDGDAAALFPAQRALVLLTPQAGPAAEWYAPRPTRYIIEGYSLVALDGFWPQEGLDEVGGPRLFQNGLELQGYNWSGSGEFWLLWQVLWLSPDDTHFFVHLLDEEGTVVGQRDAVGYPTAERRKGDRIVSRFDIMLPESQQSGPRWGRVGVYRYPSLVPVPLIDGDGRPVGDAVAVEIYP